LFLEYNDDEALTGRNCFKSNACSLLCLSYKTVWFYY